MGRPHRAPLKVLWALVLAAACSNGGGGPPQTDSAPQDGGTAADRPIPRDAFVSEPPDDTRCDPRSCDSDECGVVDDGCGNGGTMNCGPCDCVPTTCDELGYRCGTADDGCGDPLDCDNPGCGDGSVCQDHRCVCEPDGDEPNDSLDEATALGTIQEGQADTYVDRTEQNVHAADDEDWFTAHVTDDWDWEFFANPEVHVDVTSDVELEVGVYYACDAGGDEHLCQGAQPFDDGERKGCQGSSRRDVVLTPDCNGRDDAGTLSIRVRHSGDGSCESYDLSVTVL